MNKYNEIITKIYSICNQYGKQGALEKMQLINSINTERAINKKEFQSCYTLLLFLIAYPDNKAIYKLANTLLMALQEQLPVNEKLQHSLYNTGITNTFLCAAFSFEVVKWLRKTRPREIKLNSFEANDTQIQSILSAVMSKAESEILQDGNAEWKGWLKQLKRKEEDLLDQLIAVFDSSDIRPEVKEELWNTIGINVEISCTSHCCLPDSLVKTYYHRSLIRREIKKQQGVIKPVQVRLTQNEAEQIIDCSRMILLRNLREINPISFTSAKYVSYYQLQRGFSVALMGMVPLHRHPIDSYMGYMVFKNGLPLAYAGSWILFDSSRIGLNVFSDYRGGETKYIFDQVLQLHKKVYHVNRFSVDPYQIGKENDDGIRSGAFWIYYHAGFRPLQKVQQELAIAEQVKIKAGKNYRSPGSVLKILANSRLELVLQKRAVHFDATDLSRVYAAIITKKYKGNRCLAENNAAKKLAGILQIKNYQDDQMNFILKNWAVMLLRNEKELRRNRLLKKTLKKLFLLKAAGSEEAYITVMQRSVILRRFIEMRLKEQVL